LAQVQPAEAELPHVVRAQPAAAGRHVPEGRPLVLERALPPALHVQQEQDARLPGECCEAQAQALRPVLRESQVRASLEPDAFQRACLVLSEVLPQFEASAWFAQKLLAALVRVLPALRGFQFEVFPLHEALSQCAELREGLRSHFSLLCSAAERFRFADVRSHWFRDGSPGAGS
jgi:hypothetical protein